MSTVLTREQIREIDDRQIERVAVPEWGGDVFVRGLSGTDRDTFDLGMIVERKDAKGKRSQEVNLQNLRAKLVVRTAVDSDDPDACKAIFTLEDVEWLGKKSGSALQRVFSVAQRLSGLAPDDVEELTKELGEASSDGSGSDSPSPSDTLPSPQLSEPSAPESSPAGSPSTASSPLETVV